MCGDEGPPSSPAAPHPRRPRPRPGARVPRAWVGSPAAARRWPSAAPRASPRWRGGVRAPARRPASVPRERVLGPLPAPARPPGVPVPRPRAAAAAIGAVRRGRGWRVKRPRLPAPPPPRCARRPGPWGGTGRSVGRSVSAARRRHRLCRVRSPAPGTSGPPAASRAALARSLPPSLPSPSLPPGGGWGWGGRGGARARAPARSLAHPRSYLVDPASSICLSQRLSHACLSTHGRYSETANGSLNQLWFLWSLAPLLLG